MVLAISGKCCSGKNYITNFFEENKFISIDVDNISKQVFSSLTLEIIKIFGADIIANGNIDRKRVGEIIFSNKQKRVELEELLHPKIYNEIFSIISNRENDYIINIPLLTNRDLIERCNAVIWIKSPLFLRIFRALKRDSYKLISIFSRIIAQRKLSVKYFKGSVDIYYIRNGWSSRLLKKDLKFVLNRVQRG
ncbi:MAG: dephospho-CoA kinase [Spirochaetales bacterium]|nr:dephospho-CoA kinase [Spirochaetales bacterium]